MRTRPPYAIWTGILLGLLCGVAVWGQERRAFDLGAGQSSTTQPALDPKIDKILTRLENRAVHDLRARLVWRQRYILDLDEDAVTKSGEIWYQQAEPVAKFLIHFTGKIAGQRKDKLNERHLFDSRWYVELQSRTKTVTRREVRRPDDPGDPYKVGEGVFPLPFGQKKADILREFAVQRIDPAKDDPPQTDHVRLIPRASTQTGRTYKTLDFWVSREGRTAGLPIKVQVAKKDGTGKVNSYITITFSDTRLNQGFSQSVFEIKVPSGYQEIVERLEPMPPPPGVRSPGAEARDSP
ncbi:MAG: hypothetical protein KAY37_04655 [Phycisphaerae bacterium]|nr:hypothetical protein [Phycisphaerae bacterium]